MKTKKDKPRTNIVIVGTGQLKYKHPTPGRNDPCPCGSKLKFKKCCLVRIEKDRDEKLSAARDKYQQKVEVKK